MSKTTQHGNNIAYQIQGEDVYGNNETLTLADVWNILDNIHSHFVDTNASVEILTMLDRWMSEIEDIDEVENA